MRLLQRISCFYLMWELVFDKYPNPLPLREQPLVWAELGVLRLELMTLYLPIRLHQLKVQLAMA